MQEMTLGPEVAGHFAEALTLLRRRESDPVDPAGIIGADAAAVVRLHDVRIQAAPKSYFQPNPIPNPAP